MTVAVTNNFTVLNAAEATTGWTVRGQYSMIGTDSASQVEGSACIQIRVTAAGVGDATNAHGSTDFTDKHFYGWFRPSFPVDTQANGGTTIRISGTSGGATNYGEWDVAGSDIGVRAIKGWAYVTVDLNAPFDATNGTIPAITAVTDSGVGGNHLAANGMDVPIVDEISIGSLITVAGGTTSAPGLWSEIPDDVDALGKFKSVSGAFYSLVRMLFGDSGTASTEFNDTNEVVIFETDFRVTASLLGIEHIGNATGTNNFQLGELSGTGTDEEGSSGGVLKAAGDRPFRIIATDTNLDKVGYYGVTMLGPPDQFSDPFRNVKVEDNSGGPSYTEITREATGGLGNSGGVYTPPDLLPATQAANDACYFGHDARFYGIELFLRTAKTGTWTGTWEYYNGSAWTALDEVRDCTNDLSTSAFSGHRMGITYAMPNDWAKTTVDTDSRFWVRYRISSFTSSGTAPELDPGTGAVPQGARAWMVGDVQLEDGAVEAIGCNMTNMGSVVVRNGANLKKTSIIGSVAPAMSGALDLGSSDPTADTVRDLTIANCRTGIILKGSGNTTYNLRNIAFSGNNHPDLVGYHDALPITDFTDESRSATTNDVEFFPATPTSSDGFIVGHSALFDEITVDVGTAGAGTYTVTWQYLRRDRVWTNLSGVTDGTSNFKTVGANTVTWTVPTDWCAAESNTGASTADIGAKFWIRALHDGGTQTTRPLGDSVETPGDVRVDFGASDTVTINILDGGDTPQIVNVNGSTVNVENPVTTLINIKDEDGNNESGVQVWLGAADGASDLPFEQAITSITRATTTATVTFTAAHGLASNDYLKLFGITDKTEDNAGAHQVTVTSPTVCTYTTTDSGSTSYTGTITGTGGILYGTTDASGNISSTRTWGANQNVTGQARKSTSSPRYKTVELDDTVSSTDGLTINRRLTLDE